ncbi:MAG: hypothetical protein AB7D51_05120 [Desulfovibrionaceae bacterium]
MTGTVPSGSSVAPGRLRSPRLKQLHADCERIVAGAYRHPWLIANPVFARSPSTDLCGRIVLDELPKGTWWREAPKALIVYFINNISVLIQTLAQIALLRRPNAATVLEKAELVVDSSLHVTKALEKGHLELCNMDGMEQVLDKAGVRYIFLPSFSASMDRKTFHRIRSLIRRQSERVVMPHDLLQMWDALYLAAFTLAYPFLLLAFLRNLAPAGALREVLRSECMRTFGQDVVSPMLRYLSARRLVRNAPSGLKILSWCENRAGDKLFYRGLKEAAPQTFILGLQTLIFPDNYLGCYVNAAETALGCTPDRLLMNGPYYLDDHSPVEMAVGPSLRYRDLLSHPLPQEEGDTVLVLMSYAPLASRRLLCALRDCQALKGRRMVIRLHPAVPREEWAGQLPLGARFDRGDLHESLRSAAFAIGSETGALMEAVACGIPVVNVDTLGAAGLGYVPELGKGAIWFEADWQESLNPAVEAATSVPLEVRHHFAQQFREQCFSPFTPNSILSSLGFTQAPMTPESTSPSPKEATQ